VILRPCNLLQQAVDDFDLKAIQFLFFVTAAAEELASVCSSLACLFSQVFHATGSFDEQTA
jgi:hypothetical protein